MYQAPSGASGSDSRQSLSSYRSSAVILEPFEQVLPQRWWKVFPPDLRHQSPNVKRASSSLSCSCSTRSLDRVRRSASRRNRSRSASCASRPDSTSSAMTRLALAFFTLASARTRRATPAARVTLCRRGFAVLGIDSSYTTLHQAAPSTSPIAPEPKVMGSSPIGLPVELSARAQRPVRWLPLRRFVGPAVHRRTGDQQNGIREQRVGVGDHGRGRLAPRKRAHRTDGSPRTLTTSLISGRSPPDISGAPRWAGVAMRRGSTTSSK